LVILANLKWFLPQKWLCLMLSCTLKRLIGICSLGPYNTSIQNQTMWPLTKNPTSMCQACQFIGLILQRNFPHRFILP
jgi:hypothetical protein